jgi:hypothetical protein
MHAGSLFDEKVQQIFQRPNGIVGYKTKFSLEANAYYKHFWPNVCLYKLDV